MVQACVSSLNDTDGTDDGGRPETAAAPVGAKGPDKISSQYKF